MSGLGPTQPAETALAGAPAREASPWRTPGPAALDTAQRRLARSRERLREAMGMPQAGRAEPNAPAQPPRSTGVVAVLATGCTLANVALRPLAQAHPWRLVGVGLLAGAVVMASRTKAVRTLAPALPALFSALSSAWLPRLLALLPQERVAQAPADTLAGGGSSSKKA